MTSTTGRTERARHGFTLLELLVVLAIMALIAGVAWAGILGARHAAGLTGASQLIAGFVRQARSTALSSGAPVQVLIDPDRRTVSGVSQTPLIWEAFEGGSSPGFAGAGWVFEHPDIAAFPANGSTILSFPPNQALVRTPEDGFFISCWVRPPPAQSASAGEILPLVVIGHDDHGTDEILPAGGPSADFAYVGLILQLEELEVQISASQTITVPHWLPVSWLRTDTAPTAVASQAGVRLPGGTVAEHAFHPSVIPAGQESTPASDAVDPIFPVARPIVGERWIQLGLMYDGERLSTFVDGIEITRDGDGVVGPLSDALLGQIRGDPAKVRCYLGQGSDVGTPITARGQIDELRVMRIGTDRPQVLPSGVEIQGPSPKHYRILCADSSVVLFERSDPADPWTVATTPIVLSASDGGAAEIQILADGTTDVTYRAPPP